MEREHAKLKIKYDYADEGIGKYKVEQNFEEIEENDLAHKLIQSAASFLVLAGYNLPLSDMPYVIEWSQPKYKKLPTEYEIGHKFLITPVDTTKEVDVAEWNGETFDGYKNAEVLAWAYMPTRYDNSEIWY